MAIDDTEKTQKREKKNKHKEHKSEVVDSSVDKKHKKKKLKTPDGDCDKQTGDRVSVQKAKKRQALEESEIAESSSKSRKITDSDPLSNNSSKQANRRMRKRKDKFKDKVPDFLRLLQSKPKSVEEEPKAVPKTPEEIALEKMKAEKRERMRKKRIVKRENKGKKIESTVAEDAALQYLSLWNTHRQIWRFQKVRQVWLLGHLYETDKISDTNFEILLKYLEDLKGNSKDKTIEQAEKILAVAEEETEDESEDSSEEEEEEEEGVHDEEERGQEDEDEGQDEEGYEDKKKTSKKQKVAKTSTKSNKDVTSSVKYQRARQVLQILT